MTIEKILINSKSYPIQLKNIYEPPKSLYVLGNKEILKQKSIAIVGSRKASEYGKKVAFKISSELSHKDINIVSGLALGIDTYAHLGCLHANCKAKTIAVLGCGLEQIYPKENRHIAIDILKSGGCIISEYPCGTKIESKNFPERNRIISGLSNGVLIVEAAEKSGALITADFALEQGKDVFAVPGDILSNNSFGTNKLIKDGAILVTSSEDILKEI
ncbi:MAG: DNA-protecting protein DprA [Clostridia bacterium]|jgi:DNA processing protein|nr:DNA-protecting protein DprA [Clostridia bacterium]